MARKTIERDIDDRDIREHEWEGDNFHLSFNDSTNPLAVIASQFTDSEHEYAFVLDNSSRIAMKKLEGYETVDPELITNRRDIFRDAEKNRISTGDLVFMRRPRQYRDRVQQDHKNKNLSVLKRVLDQTNVSVRNIESPFSE